MRFHSIMVVMRALAKILFLLAICLAGTMSIWSQNGPLTGKWMGWTVMKGMDPMPLSGPGGNVYIQFLTADKCHIHFESNVMVSVFMDGDCTYKMEGSDCVISGTVHAKSDDGYQKSDGMKPVSIKLRLKDGVLYQEGGGAQDPDLELRYYREGTKPPPFVPKKLHSDPAAVEIFTRLKQRYANFSSFSDSGFMTSKGQGFMAKKAPFTVRYLRPNKLFVTSDFFEEAGRFGGITAWTDGNKDWETIEQDGGPPGTLENPLGNSLSTPIGPGQSYMLLAELLIPKRLGPFEENFSQVTMKPKAIVAGHPCYVLVLTSKEDYSITLWVDVNSSLLRKAYFDFDGETDTYNPVPNPHLTATDLRPAHIYK